MNDSVVPIVRDVETTYPVPVRFEERRPHLWVSTDGTTRVGIELSDGPPTPDEVVRVADGVAEWLVEQLPGEGFPAVWPECPEHPATHPLEAHLIGESPSWICPRTGTVFALIGEL